MYWDFEVVCCWAVESFPTEGDFLWDLFPIDAAEEDRPAEEEREGTVAAFSWENDRVQCDEDEELGLPPPPPPPLFFFFPLSSSSSGRRQSGPVTFAAQHNALHSLPFPTFGLFGAEVTATFPGVSIIESQ